MTRTEWSEIVYAALALLGVAWRRRTDSAGVTALT
ncbi:hypothetical protein HRbin17_00623 [bacterium HR17]|jgi:hypothetical protein|uniref:Uncharacterized protein n=1 Tax=Candidatus Fervidibacter japonicus TaxID=2035412 RepID=A0A2H5XAA2_9BACT|nr:hypothetical protein HRbin17_00623 [bacterium HR17]